MNIDEIGDRLTELLLRRREILWTPAEAFDYPGEQLFQLRQIERDVADLAALLFLREGDS